MAPSRAPPAPSEAPPSEPPRPGTRSADPLSDRATAFLIRRTLCPQQLDKDRSSPTPLSDLLPPLTSRNDVDLQLYALISIVLREFVQNWYAKITTDQTFVAETVQIVAHCTRALEQRLRKVDLESLLLDEIPDLVDRHVGAYRTAHNPIAQPPVRASPRQIYHALWPLPALSPVPLDDAPDTVAKQVQNETAYRQLLANGVLALLLPTEDLQNDCLAALVGQLLSELIMGNLVADRLSQPWLIWEGLILLARAVRERTEASLPRDEQPTTFWSSLQRLFWSLVRCLFWAAALARLLVSTVASSRTLPSRLGDVPTGGPDDHLTGQKTKEKTPVLSFCLFPAVAHLIEMPARMPWLAGTLSLLHWAAIAGPGRIAAVDGVLDRILSRSLIHAHILDPAHLAPLLRTVRASLFPNNVPGKPSLIAPSSAADLAALRSRCASAIASLVPSALASLYFGGRPRDDSSGTKDPSFSSPASSPLTDSLPSPEPGRPDQRPSAPADTPGNISYATAGDPSLPGSSRRASTSGSPRNIGSSAREKEEAGPSSSAASASASGFRPDDPPILAEIESGIVDVFADAYCNRHLVYAILELVLVRLMPELAERGIAELWNERLS